MESTDRNRKPGSPANVRNRLRRQIEEQQASMAKLMTLLGVEGDAEDLYEAVVRLRDERDALRRRVDELERG